MKKVKIINNEALFGNTQQDDFDEFNLKIGDEIEVRNFVSNAVVYQPIPKGKACFIYTWNIEDIN